MEFTTTARKLVKRRGAFCTVNRRHKCRIYRRPAANSYYRAGEAEQANVRLLKQEPVSVSPCSVAADNCATSVDTIGRRGRGAGNSDGRKVPVGIPQKPRRIRDSSNGRSGKGLLDDASGEVQVIGAKVKYRIQH